MVVIEPDGQCNITEFKEEVFRRRDSFLERNLGQFTSGKEFRKLSGFS